jgi:hypothetical protein
MRRVLLALLVVVLSILVPASASAQGPPTLNGETLPAVDPGAGQATVTVTGECNVDGTSTLTYDASGIALGPYPGPFHAQGTATISAQHFPFSGAPFPVGNVVTFDADFSIDSPIGTVEGTTELPAPSVNLGQCFTAANETTSYQAIVLFPGLRWEATITADGGRYTDRGRAEGEVQRQFGGALTDSRKFDAFLASDLSQPEPVLPTSKEDCKKGGWQKYGVFKNQGDCVSFVATHGKNPPAGP